MRVVVIVSFALVSACSGGSAEGLRCDEQRPCPEGFSCFMDRCQAGLSPTDAGLDAGSIADGGLDASRDAAEVSDFGPTDLGDPDLGSPELPIFDAGDAGPVTVAVQVTPTTLSLPAGRVRSLTAEAVFSDGTRQDVTTQAAWQSSNSAIASVESAGAEAGVVRLLTPGSTQITAAWDGMTDQTSIEVTPAVVDDIATFNKHSLVLLSNDEVWGWGWNEHRQVDEATATHIVRPILVAQLPGAAQVLAGGTHSAVLLEDGRIMTWGGNGGGQLGRPAVTFDETPAVVVDAQSQPFVAEELVLGYDFTVARKSDGTVWTWGADSFGSLGRAGAASATPGLVAGLPVAAEIAAGTYHALIRAQNGTVWSWGYNFYGQLGIGTAGDGEDSPVAVQMRGVGGNGVLTDVIDISAGWGHTAMLVGSNRRIVSVGWNVYGQLADISTADRSLPVLTAEPTGLNVQYVLVKTGFGHTIGQSNTGELWSWGSNQYGELGIGTFTPPSLTRPERVRLMAGGTPFVGATKVQAGGDFNLVLKNDGTVWIWGANVNGELGNGQIGGATSVAEPRRVTGW